MGREKKVPSIETGNTQVAGMRRKIEGDDTTFLPDMKSLIDVTIC
jgi:hypothetical protein